MAKHVFWGAIVASSIIIALLFLYSNTMDFLNATVGTLYPGIQPKLKGKPNYKGKMSKGTS